jgi:hypothetical protein
VRVGGPDGSGWAVGAVVGDAYRVGVVLVGDHRKDRSEDFFAGDAHVVVDAGEDRRRDVPASFVAGWCAAGGDVCAFGAAGVDVAVDPVALPAGGQWTDLGGRVGGVADGHGPHGGDQGVYHVLVPAVWGEEAGLCHAGLAVVGEGGVLESGRGGGQVGVVADDRGRLAAELQGVSLEVLAAERRDSPAGGGGAGERHHVDTGVPDEVLTGRGPAGDDVLRAVPRHDRRDHAGRFTSNGDRPGRPEAFFVPGRRGAKVCEVTPGRGRGAGLQWLGDRRADLFGDQRGRSPEPAHVTTSPGPGVTRERQAVAAGQPRPLRWPPSPTVKARSTRCRVVARARRAAPPCHRSARAGRRASRRRRVPRAAARSARRRT